MLAAVQRTIAECRAELGTAAMIGDALAMVGTFLVLPIVASVFVLLEPIK